MTTLRQNFKYPELNDRHPVYGASLLMGDVVRADGDWREYTPTGEAQAHNGLDPSDCYIEAQQHIVATLEEELFNEKNNNYSARFNALLSNGAPDGGDPVAGADSIRDDGLVNEADMPFDNTIQTWDEFHSWYGVDEQTVRGKGQNYRQGKRLNFGVIVQKQFPLGDKYTILKRALQRSPVGVSVWGQVDGNGQYLPKPDGVSDTHFVELTYIDANNVPYIRDSYAPFDKQLPANYNFDFGIAWAIKKITAEDLSVVQKVFNALWSNGLLKCFSSFINNFLTPKV